MAGVEEGRAQIPGASSRRCAVSRDAAEAVEAVERVERACRAARAQPRALAACRLARAMPRLLLVQMRGIEHHQARQFARRGGGDDLAAEAALDEQRQAPAVVEMGVGQQQEVDCRGVEAEGLGILLIELAPALIHAAVDQDAAAGALDQVAGAGDAAVGAVE